MRATVKRFAAVVLVLVTMASAGAAWAFWTSFGNGAAAGSSTTVAVLSASSGTPTATLYPGSTASVVTKLTNSGTADVRVSSIALASGEGTAGFDVDASHSGCGLDSLSFTTQTAGWTVPAGGSLTISLANSLAMASSADNECQGATFTVHLKVAS